MIRYNYLLIRVIFYIAKVHIILQNPRSDLIYNEIFIGFCSASLYILIKKWLFVKFGAKWQFLGYPKKT